MKKYLFILLLFLVSCHNNDNNISAIHFRFRYEYDYTVDIVIGTDTQLVDSIYNAKFNFYYRRWGRTHGDSINSSAHARKYYISKDMNKILMKYIKGHNDKDVNCDSLLLKMPYPEFYYNITAIDSSGKKDRFCMAGKQNVLVYFIGLEKALERIPDKNPEYAQMLSDLSCFFDGQPFSQTPKEQAWMLKVAKPELREEFINSWHSHKEMVEKDLNKVRDSLKSVSH